MKKRLLSLIVVCLLVGSNFVFATKGTSPVDTVIQFYNAYKDGDIQTMRQLTAGSFYKRRKVLLEENREYPNFLRQRYQGIQVKIINSVIEKNNISAEVDVELEFPDSTVDTNKLLLKKDAGGIWKIVDEKMEP